MSITFEAVLSLFLGSEVFSKLLASIRHKQTFVSVLIGALQSKLMELVTLQDSSKKVYYLLVHLKTFMKFGIFNKPIHYMYCKADKKSIFIITVVVH